MTFSLSTYKNTKMITKPTDDDPVINERSGNVREVGGHAVWSLSSCKPGIAKWMSNINNQMYQSIVGVDIGRVRC